APFALFLGAAMLSGYHNGVRAGLLAVVLGAAFLFSHHYFLADTPSRGGDFAPSLVLLVLLGGLANYLSWECHRAAGGTMRFVDAFARMRDGVILTDSAGRVHFLNDTAQTLTGWNNLNAVQEPVDRIFQPIMEDSRRPVASPVAALLT